MLWKIVLGGVVVVYSAAKVRLMRSWARPPQSYEETRREALVEGGALTPLQKRNVEDAAWEGALSSEESGRRRGRRPTPSLGFEPPVRLLVSGYDCTDDRTYSDGGSEGGLPGGPGESRTQHRRIQANVPHTHYQRGMRRRALSSLYEADADTIARVLDHYTTAELDSLYKDCVQENRWQTALNFSRAQQMKGRVLPTHHVVATLATLLQSEQNVLAVHFYKEAKGDQYQLPGEVLANLFELCCPVSTPEEGKAPTTALPQVSMPFSKDKAQAHSFALVLLDAVRVHRVKPTPQLQGTILRTFATLDWALALTLYQGMAHQIRSGPDTALPVDVPSDGTHLSLVPPNVHRHLLPALLQAACCASDAKLAPVHRYHESPLRAAWELYGEMKATAPKEVAPALMTSLLLPEAKSRWASALCQHHLGAPGSKKASAWMMAVALLGQVPEEGSLPSSHEGDTVEGFTKILLKEVDASALAAASAPSFVLLANGLKTQFAPKLPKRSETTVRIAHQLHHTRQWRLALGFAQQLVKTKNLAAVPILAMTAATSGQWLAANRLCTQLFATRAATATPTGDELSMCVHSAIQAGKWSSAMFWIERAHARGHQFSQDLYDATFVSNTKTSWDASLSAFVRMRHAGGNSGEEGVKAVLDKAGQHDKFDQALDLMAFTDSIEWRR